MRMKPTHGVYNSLGWLGCISEEQKEDVIQCCTNAEFEPAAVLSRPAFGPEERSHLLMLRGLLSGKLLQHCLRKLLWKTYGVANR